VFLALPGLRRTQPGYWQSSLLMNIFGGNDSLMYTRLRDDLGLVYSAWFTQTYKWKAGLLVGYIGCKADKTALAIAETLKIMRALRRNVPEQEFRQKRLDALNSFVFNVDTPQDLVVTYGRYFLRREPLDTLELIQTAFLDATPEALKQLADRLLDPGKVQIVVVTDLGTAVSGQEGAETVGEALRQLAPGQMLVLYTPELARVEQVLPDFPDYITHQVYGDRLHIFVDDAAASKPRLQAFLQTADIPVQALYPDEPRLEEAFIHLIRQARTEATP